jgi:arginyl-tRNA synthetase
MRRALAEMGVEDVEELEVHLERPRDPDHGDLATNVALTLASRLRRAPRAIAEELAERLELPASGVTAVEVAGPGFLNFRLSTASLGESLLEILGGDTAYGRSAVGQGRPIMVEWVSANPTGPLHPGHGRQVALGDAIARLLEWTGWAVHREFYYNDAGVQMVRLAESVQARYRQLLGQEAEIPEGGYHGDYVTEVARELREEEGDRWEEDGSPDALDAMRRFASRFLMKEIRRDLDDLRVHFDEYYRETSLYEEGRVDDVIADLREAGFVYEKEGAVWLRTTEFGDQKDRVMVKSDGNPTYFLPDVAYHISKWERGFEHVINVQGADHHSTVDRVRAGLQALGLPQGYPEYVLHQMVTFERQGEVVKLSKRAGASATLRELFEEVGVDVARYFFQMRKPEAHLVFDLDMALDQSEKNPVYKIQYAHARMHQIFAKAGVAPDAVGGDEAELELLATEDERELVKQLAEFPRWIERAAAARAPHLLCDYLEQTAGAVHSWYHAGNPSRNPELAVLVDDPALRAARLVLARAIEIVLRNGLTVLGITAPRRMEREDTQGTD